MGQLVDSGREGAGVSPAFFLHLQWSALVCSAFFASWGWGGHCLISQWVVLDTFCFQGSFRLAVAPVVVYVFWSRSALFFSSIWMRTFSNKFVVLFAMDCSKSFRALINSLCLLLSTR